MKHLARFASAIGLVALTAAPVLAGPDFVTSDRAKAYAASDAHNENQPMDDIIFHHDDASLLPTAQAQLAAAARWMNSHPRYHLVLQGFADSSGGRGYNAQLANRRTVIARNHLVAAGVDPDRIVIAVYGEQGVHRRPHPLDRRVVLFASRAPVGRLVAAELSRNALELTWTRNGARYHESRGIAPASVIATR